MSHDIVKYIIIDKEQDVEITSEVCIENKNILYDSENIIRPNHSIASFGRDRLVWYYNKLHIITPYHYLVQIYAADLRKDQLLLEDNVLAIKNWLENRRAYFSLGAALVCINSKTQSVFITARDNAFVRCLVNGQLAYERAVSGRWDRV